VAGEAGHPRRPVRPTTPNKGDAGCVGGLSTILLIPMAILGAVAAFALLLLGREALAIVLTKVGHLLGERLIYGLFGAAFLGLSAWLLRRVAIRWPDLQVTAQQRAASVAIFVALGAFGALLLAIGLLQPV